jgi:hypothetical protein
MEREQCFGDRLLGVIGNRIACPRDENDAAAAIGHQRVNGIPLVDVQRIDGDITQDQHVLIENLLWRQAELRMLGIQHLRLNPHPWPAGQGGTQVLEIPRRGRSANRYFQLVRGNLDPPLGAIVRNAGFAR